MSAKVTNGINPTTGKPFTPREAREHFLAKAARLGFKPSPVVNAACPLNTEGA